MKIKDFDIFFHEVMGVIPFPWQRRLAKDLCKNGWNHNDIWSAIYGLPTASGKTAIQIIWTFALAYQIEREKRRIPLRLFWVVDRRVVVDEAHALAVKIRDSLMSGLPGSVCHEVRELLRRMGSVSHPLETECPLQAVRMRGGLYRDESWLRDPRLPSLISTTIDQVGSAFLFRKYGAGSNVWPIFAGLVANDSAILNDEAHLSSAFMKTLESIKAYGGNFINIRISATPRDSPTFSIKKDDMKDPVLRTRLRCKKHTSLVYSDKPGNLPKILAKEAKRLASGTNVVAIICNTIKTARSSFNILSEDKKSDTILLIGRSRQWDRDKHMEDRGIYFRNINRIPVERTLYVVSTQCIEAGADFDFDEMVSEAAPLDCLIQRSGRLGRSGRDGRFVIVGGDIQDPIYGGRSISTWKWLEGCESLDFSYCGQRGMIGDCDHIDDLISQSQESPYLSSDLFETWAQTSPRPKNDADIDLFLHGYQRNTDITIIWRGDLQLDDKILWPKIITQVPPVNGEGIEIPIWEARRFLDMKGRGKDGKMLDIGDVSSIFQDEKAFVNIIPVLRWGEAGAEIIENFQSIRPGDTIVIPCSYGGADEFGWTGSFSDIPSDIAEDIMHLNGERKVVRLHKGLIGEKLWSMLEEYFESMSDERLLDRKSIRRILKKHPRWHMLEDFTDLNIDRYPGDIPAIFVHGKHEPLQRDRKNWSSFSNRDILLEDHGVGVGDWAYAYAKSLLSDGDEISDVKTAGIFHDLGKADPRWQDFITGGNADAGHIFAKSSKFAILDFMPKGLRHEFASLFLIESSSLGVTCSYPELVKYLVASHHGRGRCFAPAYDDKNSCGMYKHMLPDGDEVSVSTAYPYAKVDSGWSDRFFSLLQRYGPWKLAYLESILRLADWRQSIEEQKYVD